MRRFRFTTKTCRKKHSMNVLPIAISMLFLPFTFTTSYAQEPEINSVSANDTTVYAHNASDNTNTSVVDATAEQETRWQKVWKRRAYYLNLSYGMQTLKGGSTNLKSDMAFALVWGRTYYLHKKPIAGLLKFGLDANFIDLNYAQYPDFPKTETNTTQEDTDILNLGIKQADFGIGVGPSVTVNPIDQLKICGYFHVTPSYSLLIQNGELYSHYTTFFNVGLTPTYKVIQLGFEMRWCSPTKYGAASFGRVSDVYDDNGNFHDPFEKVDVKMKTTTSRIFIGFRF